MTPVVLHHGLFGGDFGGDYTQTPPNTFRGIDTAIAAAGYPITVSACHPTAGIEKRAQQLKEWILGRRRELGTESVVLMAYSLGGLDARFMLSRLEMAKHVSALVTICTPHRGSPYADWCVKNIGQRMGLFRLVKRFGLDIQGAIDLTTDRCAKFNEEIKDMPGVKYYSISAVRPWHKVPPFAMHAHGVVYRAEGDNDSLVSVKSATWGEHLATWPVDHWHSINRRYLPEIRNRTGDIAPYYLQVLSRILGHRMAKAG